MATSPPDSTPRTRLDFASIEVSPPLNWQVAFVPAPVHTLTKNPIIGTETRTTPVFPRLPLPLVLPLGYSPSRYTWTRNQTTASSSASLGTQHNNGPPPSTSCPFPGYQKATSLTVRLIHERQSTAHITTPCLRCPLDRRSQSTHVTSWI